MRAVFTRTLISLSLLSSQAAWAIPFQTQLAIDNADNPLSITSADFNNDGNADLAVTSYSADKTTNEIKVLLGAGDATFGTAVSYTTGTAPSSITSADMNGSGIDLAVANSDDNSLSVFINNTDGSFANKVDYTTGTTPIYILAAELNGANSDLITANSGSDTISVFINNNDGSFASKVDYNTGLTPNAITAADFDSDGDTDLAVTNATDNTVSVFINNGAGVFAAKVDYTTGTAPSSIASQDISGDNFPDLVISNSDSNNISILMNNGSGDGSFANKIDYATGTTPEFVSISDLDNDSDLDIAVSNSDTDTISIFSNDSDGSLSSKTDAISIKGPNAIVAQDIDNDSYTDLITTNLLSHNFSYLKNLTAQTPNSFSFTAQTDVARSSKITSNQVTLSGLINSTTLNISGKEISNPDNTTTYSAEYSTDGGSTFTSDPTTVNNGTTIRVRLLSSDLYNKTETATITIGGFSTEFNVTTAPENETPIELSFTAVAGVEPGAIVTSENVTINWLDAAASILVINGEYSINDTAFTSTPGTINNNDTLKLRLTSSTNFGGRKEALVSINSGEKTTTFVVFTKDNTSSGDGGSSSLSLWISLFMTGALLLRYRKNLRQQHRLSHSAA